MNLEIPELWPACVTHPVFSSFKMYAKSVSLTVCLYYMISHADRMSPWSSLTLLIFKQCRIAAASPSPPLLVKWYLPRTSSPLPSLSQICLHSKEIHSTFNSGKESAVSALQLGTHRVAINRKKGRVDSGGGRTLGWRVMTRKLVNLWEIPWALLPPPSNVSVVGAMASQSG